MIREVLTLERLQRLGANEAAAMLRVRQDAGGDYHDDAVFDAWLASDPANAEAWTRACRVWADFDGIGDHPELQRLREVAMERPARTKHWGLAIAASLVAVVATGGALLLRQPSDQAGTTGSGLAANADSLQTLTSAKGEHRTFALADKSTVTLNTGTTVVVAFKPGVRRLQLIRGQAFFKVAPDKVRPFIVTYEGRTVTALGTAFEIRADRNVMRVVLVEGQVSVSRADSAAIVMRPGQQVLATARGLTLSSADLGAVEDWQRGVVTFRNTTLKAAAAEFNRYADQQLVVTDPRVAQLTVSGVFHTNDPSRFARTIEAILPVRVVPAGGEKLEIVPGPAISSR